MFDLAEENFQFCPCKEKYSMFDLAEKNCDQKRCSSWVGGGGQQERYLEL